VSHVAYLGMLVTNSCFELGVLGRNIENRVYILY